MKRATRTKKGFFCMLLACAMVWCLVWPAASAAETEPVTAEVTISTGLQEQPTAEVEAVWNDAWFAGDAGEYRQELARTAMALSAAAYAETDGGVSVRDALEDFGFAHLQSYNYRLAAVSSDRAAYTFGLKTVQDQEGGETTLVAIVIRGTGTYTEWAGNLDVGSGSDHKGFAQARDELLGNLERYLAKAEIDEDRCKFFLTGHSRGGAAANLTATRLTDEGREVCAYTFAAPAVSLEAEEEGYETIFNVIREDDLVTQVPLADWGYGRYGVDQPLPTADSAGEDYDALFSKMEEQYKALTGQDFAAYQDPAAVREMTAALRLLVPDTEGVNMAIVSALLRGDVDDLTQLVSENRTAALLMGWMTVELSAKLTPLLRQERAGMVSAHCMAGYYSWLTVETE